MADSSIEWTDKVWNPVTGCTKVSQGCKNCYAETIAERFFAKQYPPNADGSLRKFTDVRCHEDRLEAPLHWRKPSRIFVNSMSDLFHEDVPIEFIDKVFAVMALAKTHTFQVLTKRPKRMLEYLKEIQDDEKDMHRWEHWACELSGSPCASGAIEDAEWPLKNVWLGVSVENQKAANERIPILLKTPAEVRWISAEPLLEPISFRWPMWNEWPDGGDINEYDGFKGAIDWVVVGAESGNGARPMNEDWVRTIRDQCQEAGVAFFYKQRAENGRAISTPELDGKKWVEYPA